MEPEEPPPKTYGFKDRAFKRDNAPTAALPSAPTARELAIMAGPVVRSTAPGAAGPRAGDPNDVYTLLQENRAAAQRDGLNEVVIRKKMKSRRRRDYWLLLLATDTGLIVTGLLGRHNVVVVVSAFAGVIIASIGLTWVMWFVMDDY